MLLGATATISIRLDDVSFAVASTVDGGNGTDKLKQEDVSGPVNYVNFP
jgi:hypothetical protein